MPRRRVQLNAVQTLALGFAALILLGGVLLALPVSSRDGRSLPFLDALFTAASASCVTGLVLYDTCTQFTLFGQAVILLLIQVGGMGFMTVSILVAVLLHRRIGLRQRSILMDSVGALQMGGIVRLTRRAIRVTLTCEGAGAALLALWFCPRYGLGLGLWMSLFHAVSSFCNAGFDLLGTGASLTTIAGEPLPNIVLMALVICGGLGFLVWDDLLTHGRHVRRWRLHSKIVLFSTTLLFAGGAIAFYFLEKDHAFAGAGPGRRALMAAFQSVTCRTAGFNTAPLTALSQSGTLLTMILMFIGAGSGSTGGGVKVTTVVVCLLTLAAYIRGRREVGAFNRRLDEEQIHRSAAGVTLYMALAMAGGFLILATQPFPLQDALFEVFSALSTVGLSTGITRDLSPLNRAVVIAMMYCGRIGSLSMLMALAQRSAPRVKDPVENITIG